MTSNDPRVAWRELDGAVQVLAPASASAFSDFLAASAESRGEPFSESRRATVGALSAAFLQDPVLRQDPASVAVAFWMRPAALGRLHAQFERAVAADASSVRVPVGNVFHVAPSNVDTLFVYSWVLSFLCGNANVVRVSRERPAVVEAMLSVISAVAGGYPELRDGNRFVTYEHQPEITTKLSGWCGHRILWGGDETVAALRPLPLNPHASERVFGSKFSYTVLAAAAYRSAAESERQRLAGAFFNDLFWFDQMACSSPQVVFWVGGALDWEAAVAEFEDRLQAEVERRGYHPSVPNAVHRLNYAFELAADADVRVDLGHSGFASVRMLNRNELTKDICGGGLIRHARIEQLLDLATFASEADQTVTHFGFGADELRELAVRIGARGVDRIVPIGEALSFNVLWDGFDLLDDLTRRVFVQTSAPSAPNAPGAP